MNIEAAKDMLKRHEGYRVFVYKDSLGIPTIGVGFNLARIDARDRVTALGLDFDEVLSGKQALSWAQVNQLLSDDIDACLVDLRKMFADFDAMPDEAQLVLLDLRFNLGPARLRGFVRTLEAFRERKFKKAARFLEATLWARQVGVRARDDVARLRRLTNGDHEP